MADSVRLSEASRGVVEALSTFDHHTLEQWTDRMQAAVAGDIAIEAEPIELIATQQKVLAGVLMSTEQNLSILRRLRQRKAGNEWVL